MAGPPIALPILARNLRIRFRDERPQGYREGKKRIVETVMRFYDCSPRIAKGLVKDLESEGFTYARGRDNVRRRARKAKDATWYFDPSPP